MPDEAAWVGDELNLPRGCNRSIFRAYCLRAEIDGVSRNRNVCCDSAAETLASGNGHNISQTGTNRPILAAADLNSLNTLRFTAANSQSYPVNISWLNSLTSASLYMVYKAVAGDGNTFFDTGSSASSSNWPFTDNGFYNEFGTSVRKTCGAASNGVGIYKTLSIYSAPSDWALYVDGGTGGSGGGTSALFSTASNTVGWTTSPPSLGASTKSGVVYFNGWLAEFLITNAKESVANRQKVEGYLAWKWGLTGNLSASHPYKSSPP